MRCWSRDRSAALPKLVSLIGGQWFSTQAAGECAEGQRVGEGCWWRLAEQKRNVNASCVNDRMVSAVINTRPGCWQGCPQPHNATSACWITCLFETLVGYKLQAPSYTLQATSHKLQATS